MADRRFDVQLVEKSGKKRQTKAYNIKALNPLEATNWATKQAEELDMKMDWVKEVKEEA